MPETKRTPMPFEFWFALYWEAAAIVVSGVMAAIEAELRRRGEL